MKYVIVLMAAVMLFAVIYWYVAGKYYYTGPRVKAQLIMEMESEDSPPNEKVPMDDLPRE